MLNRRHLRVKVMQTLYAFSLSEDKQVKNFEKALLTSVDEVNQMYIWTLNLLDEVAEYVLIDAEGRANKFLPTEKDKVYTTKLNSNSFIESLRQNRAYLEFVKKYKVSWSFDPEIVRSIFAQLKESEEYMAYLKQEDRSIAAEKDIIKFIFKKIVLKSPDIEQVFEAKFINWPVDREVLQAMVAKTFKNFSSESPAQNKLAELTPNWEEDTEFITELLKQTIRYGNEYQELISAKTKNWEADRIALVDNLLMRMAICELVNFPTIPVKVTINEYIELSKAFSTSKSNTFINGILDKILADLTQQRRIQKQGRGLRD
ncbi:NusB antitermination factor [Sphingobacterium allocomposti]|jgi:N utilization substance protein B|uniref:NusB antitermination factor n=1 Tax=Sphingobacterium allocomposti TaxID=415956 RepID=A0A5S5DEV2_9SPHI|nr:transcription antitermination factor NusB [Sphingobacterium composti Yoo et al. 2007 non Ten et al. 2007]TYP93149.1 NusB antitermination factor [Sphingobacterium composti Yoo et al. 2007 non Ten et al. 2007]HLS94454.1 transcription antitermination factor NusB [Sphingobacterium sp.]